MPTGSRRLRLDRRGNVAIVFALSSVPVIAGAGAAVDLGRMTVVRTELQGAADAAAIAAQLPRGLSVAERDQIAETTFRSNDGTGLDPVVAMSVAGDELTVTASVDLPMSVMAAFGFDSFPIAVSATAHKQTGGPPPCIVGLNRSASGAVKFSGGAQLTADACVVYSNSSADDGMIIQSNTVPKAAGFCAVGGVYTSKSVSPKPQGRCPEYPDPLAGRISPPSTTGCDFNNVDVKPGVSVTLKPGIYCGGLSIRGTATLEAGTYVVKGAFKVTSQAAVDGKAGVTFYTTGDKAGFDIQAGGALDLRAPASGPMSGLLVVQDPSSNPGAGNTLSGNSSSSIAGVIYTPTQGVTIAGSAGFGQTAPSLAVIADTVDVTGSISAKVDLAKLNLVEPLPPTESAVRLSH